MPQLKEGSKGGAVMILQLSLIRLGFDASGNLKANGMWDSLMTIAVAAAKGALLDQKRCDGRTLPILLWNSDLLSTEARELMLLADRLERSARSTSIPAVDGDDSGGPPMAMGSAVRPLPGVRELDPATPGLPPSIPTLPGAYPPPNEGDEGTRDGSPPLTDTGSAERF